MANVTASRLTVDDGTITWDDMTIDGTLTISGAATFDTNVTFDGDTAGQDLVWNAASSGGSLIFEDNVKAKFGDGGDLEIVHNGNDSYISAVVDGRDFYIQTTVDRALHLRQNSGERITLNTDDSITLTGNVGIGTASPSYALHVEGGANTRLFMKSTTGDALLQVDSADEAYIIMSRAGTGKWAMTNNNAPGADTWSLYNYPNNFHALTVTEAGNVGIGVAPNSNYGVHIDKTFTATGWPSQFRVSGTLTGAVNNDMHVITMGSNTLVEAASGTHALATGMALYYPTLTTSGGATTTNASTLYINGSMSGATSGNYALWVDAGNARFDGSIQVGTANGNNLNLMHGDIIDCRQVYTDYLVGDADTNTYIQFPGYDRIDFYAGGTRRAYVSSGNWHFENHPVYDVGDAEMSWDSTGLNLGGSQKLSFRSTGSAATATSSWGLQISADSAYKGYISSYDDLTLSTQADDIILNAAGKVSLKVGGNSGIEMNSTSINYIKRISVTGGTAPWCTLTAGTGCTIVRQDWTQPGGSYDPYYVKVWFEIAQSTGSTKKLRYTFTRGANGITFAHVTEITGEYPSGYQRMLRANCQTTDGGGTIFHSASSENFSSAGAWASTSGTNDVIWESAAIITSGGAVYGWVEFMIHRGSGTIPTEIEIDYS